MIRRYEDVFLTYYIQISNAICKKHFKKFHSRSSYFTRADILVKLYILLVAGRPRSHQRLPALDKMWLFPAPVLDCAVIIRIIIYLVY